MQRRGLTDWVVFALLVAIAIVGRTERIDWNFTPIAAATVFAGYYFGRAWIAALLPVIVLAASDWQQLSHDSAWVMAAVWLTFAFNGLLGPWLRRAKGIRSTVGRGMAAAFIPSALFYVTTDLAVWATEYSLTFENLMIVYIQALPFYGRMLAADLVYGSVLFGAYALALLWVGNRPRQLAPVVS